MVEICTKRWNSTPPISERRSRAAATTDSLITSWFSRASSRYSSTETTSFSVTTSLSRRRRVLSSSISEATFQVSRRKVGT